MKSSSVFRRPGHVGGLLGVILALGGCVGGSHAETRVSVESVAADTQCQRLEPGMAAFVATDQASLQRLNEAGSDSLRRAAATLSGERMLVLVSMGEQPTGGYALALADTVARVANGNAELKVRVVEPDEGAIVTQALTSPCLLLSVERDHVRSVTIVDADERILASADVPAADAD